MRTIQVAMPSSQVSRLEVHPSMHSKVILFHVSIPEKERDSSATRPAPESNGGWTCIAHKIRRMSPDAHQRHGSCIPILYPSSSYWYFSLVSQKYFTKLINSVLVPGCFQWVLLWRPHSKKSVNEGWGRVNEINWPSTTMNRPRIEFRI
jgi:hypothetical protein